MSIVDDFLWTSKVLGKNRKPQLVVTLLQVPLHKLDEKLARCISLRGRTVT